MKVTTRVGLLAVGAVVLGVAGCAGSGPKKNDTDAGKDAAELAAEVPAADGTDVATPEDTGPDVPREEVPLQPDGAKDAMLETPVGQCSPECDTLAGQYCDEDEWQCKKMHCQICYKDKQCGEGGFCLDYSYSDDDKVGLCSKTCATAAECPDGFTCDPAPGHCVPKAVCKGDACGPGELGAPCQSAPGVHSGCGYCKDGLLCVGNFQVPENTCEYDKDCVTDHGFPMSWNPDCVGGICNSGYCTRFCDENGECPSGFVAVAMDAPVDCACAAVDVGTSKPGDGCPWGNINVDKDPCEEGLSCWGVPPGDFSLVCSEDSDCQHGWGPGDGTCMDGLCVSSFCIAKCDEDGACGDLSHPIDAGGTCYCLPHPKWDLTGDGKKDDPCPFGNVNGDSPTCGEFLGCFGLPAYEFSPQCNTPEDCPATFFGEVDCFLGYCGSSTCVAECNADGTCPAGYAAWVLDDACLCVPGNSAGAAKVGEACPAWHVNSAADTCAPGLACYCNSASLNPSEKCAVPADCDPVKHPGVVDCVDGMCGSSYCSAMCDAGGNCPAGFKPAGGKEEGSMCYCVI